MRDAAIDRAVERIVTTLRAQGVDEARAREFVESHVRLDVASGLKVHAVLEGSGLRSRGTSDEYHTYFAREIHLHHPEIGGKPEPFGAQQPPEFEGAIEDRARRDKGIAEAAAATRARVERDQQWNREQDVARAQRQARDAFEGVTPRASF